jgi:hypothetical protein
MNFTAKDFADATAAVHAKVPGWGYAKMFLDLWDYVAELDLDSHKIKEDLDFSNGQLMEAYEQGGFPVKVTEASWQQTMPPATGQAVYVCSDRVVQVGGVWRHPIEGKAIWDGQYWRHAESGELWKLPVTHWLKIGKRLQQPQGNAPSGHWKNA